jgi:hypothetical protein
MMILVIAPQGLIQNNLQRVFTNWKIIGEWAALFIDRLCLQPNSQFDNSLSNIHNVYAISYNVRWTDLAK